MNSQKIIIIIIIFAVLVLIASGIGVYYSIYGNFKFNFIKFGVNPITNATNNSNNESVVKIETPSVQEVENQNKINYPDTVIGTINFLDKGSVIKSTIKTSGGKEYTLSPNQPKAIYESFGAKDGKKVEIQGKITADNKLEWLTMKAI